MLVRAKHNLHGADGCAQTLLQLFASCLPACLVHLGVLQVTFLLLLLMASAAILQCMGAAWPFSLCETIACKLQAPLVR